MIVHTGKNTQGGHYTCYVRGLEDVDCWYLCNDHNIKKLKGVEDALHKQAYLLFYQLKEIRN